MRWLFTIIPSYFHALFEYLAIFLGVQFYRYTRLKSGGGGLLKTDNFSIVMGCILGAAIGNKLAFLIQFPSLVLDHGLGLNIFLAGQSIVGGLIGGLIGVEITKKIKDIQHSTGDDFVYPILLSIIVGRIGCFFAGLSDGTYGIQTTLPWGVDFGDGVARHPTQLYDILFAAGLWFLLKRFELRLGKCSGLRFKCMLSAYLIWRFIIDFLKPLPFSYLGLMSGIQVICILFMIFYTPTIVAQIKTINK